jgi:hypothetical protein
MAAASFKVEVVLQAFVQRQSLTYGVCAVPVCMQVGAAGAVREAHGHMLGPDEAALLESDDSDKVGYADEAAAETAAAAAETAATAAGGSGGKRGRQAAMKAAGGSSGGSKKPKRGLGCKG